MAFTTALLCPNGNGTPQGKCPCCYVKINVSIFTAAEWGMLAHVRERVGAGKDPNAEDSSGYTMLHYAAQHNHEDVVRYLLQQRADVNASACGATPLHRAAFNGHSEVCQLLLQAGADPNSVDVSFGDRRTPLHKAASQGHYGVVRILLEKCVDVSLRDAAGLTALNVAVGERVCESISRVAGPDSVRPEQRFEAKPVSIEGSRDNTGAHVVKPDLQHVVKQAEKSPRRTPSVSGAVCSCCKRHVLAFRRLPCCGELQCSSCVRRLNGRKCGICREKS